MSTFHLFEVYSNLRMHFWIRLTFLILLAFFVWIYIAICDAYGQLIDECHPQIVEQHEEEITLEPICELNKFYNDDGIAASILTHAFIVFVGYLSYNLL